MRRDEWALEFLAHSWSSLLAQFSEDTSDDEARDLAAAMAAITEAQFEILGDA